MTERALAALALVACGGRASEIALPQTVEHPLYRVRAMLPAGWVADAARAPIYPADTWSLHPTGALEPRGTLILGWLPRGGRQSAMFPGERDSDAHHEARTIGGVSRDGLVESAGRSFKVDFDVGELAVSIATWASDDAQRATVDAIVAHLAFDPAARAPDHPSPARRALELARAWAKQHGHPPDGLVYVGQPPGSPLYAFTLFHAKGLVALRVDLAAGTVVEAPL